MSAKQRLCASGVQGKTRQRRETRAITVELVHSERPLPTGMQCKEEASKRLDYIETLRILGWICSVGSVVNVPTHHHQSVNLLICANQNGMPQSVTMVFCTRHCAW